MSLDTSVADEDDAVLQVINHRGAIHHAGLLGDDIYALSTDEHLTIYVQQHQDLERSDPSPFVVGDLRQHEDCEYAIKLLNRAASPLIAVGNHSNGQSVRLIPQRRSPGLSPSWSSVVSDIVTLSGGHGEDVVRDVLVSDSLDAVFTCGEVAMFACGYLWPANIRPGNCSRQNGSTTMRPNRLANEQKTSHQTIPDRILHSIVDEWPSLRLLLQLAVLNTIADLRLNDPTPPWCHLCYRSRSSCVSIVVIQDRSPRCISSLEMKFTTPLTSHYLCALPPLLGLALQPLSFPSRFTLQVVPDIASSLKVSISNILQSSAWGKDSLPGEPSDGLDGAGWCLACVPPSNPGRYLGPRTRRRSDSYTAGGPEIPQFWRWSARAPWNPTHSALGGLRGRNGPMVDRLDRRCSAER